MTVHHFSFFRYKTSFFGDSFITWASYESEVKVYKRDTFSVKMVSTKGKGVGHHGKAYLYRILYSSPLGLLRTMLAVTYLKIVMDAYGDRMS